MTRLFHLNFHRLVVASMLFSLLAMAARVAVDRDTWWHLRAGAWMVAHGQVLDHDVFTSAFARQAWSYPAWLSQTTLYLIFERFGYAGLNLLMAMCVVAAFALVYAATSGGVYVRALAVLLGAAASAVTWSAGPHLASLVLGAAFLLILHLFRRHARTQYLNHRQWQFRYQWSPCWRDCSSRCAYVQRRLGYGNLSSSFGRWYTESVDWPPQGCSQPSRSKR